MTPVLKLGFGFLVAGCLAGCYSASAFQSEDADLFVKPHPIYKFYGIFGTGFDLTDPQGHSISFSNAPPGGMEITFLMKPSDVRRLVEAGCDVVEIAVYDSYGESLGTTYVPLGMRNEFSTDLVPRAAWNHMPKGRVHIGWNEADWLYSLADSDGWQDDFGDEFPANYWLEHIELGRPQRTLKFRLYERAEDIGEIWVYPLIRQGDVYSPIG
ncbi:MAG: hypothetical protein ACIAQF_01765 [Phycisphaerales bacterium JB065]